MDHHLILELEEGMRRREAAIPAIIRPFTIEKDHLSRALMITGPRGTGKTTFLLYHSRGKHLLYISADNPTIANIAMYDLVKSIFLAGYEGVIVDEVHFAANWSLHLKALYDEFPDRSIWVSDSSSLVLRSGVADLSRRFVPIRMPLMSFREFLALETGRSYPIYDPFCQSSTLPVSPTPDLLSMFRKYRMIGTRPFYAENDFQDRMLAVLDKTLYADVPFFLPGINEGNLRLMKAIVATLAHSAIPRLQVRSLCADWAIGSEKLYQILEVLESVGILRTIRLENDTKAKSVGQKLFFADPVLYSVVGGDRGTAREALVSMCLASSGWKFEAARDETMADFILSPPPGSSTRKKVSIEVGGAAKSAKRADFVIRDESDYPAANAIPLWLLGFMY